MQYGFYDAVGTFTYIERSVFKKTYEKSVERSRLAIIGYGRYVEGVRNLVIGIALELKLLSGVRPACRCGVYAHSAVGNGENIVGGALRIKFPILFQRGYVVIFKIPALQQVNIDVSGASREKE